MYSKSHKSLSPFDQLRQSGREFIQSSKEIRRGIDKLLEQNKSWQDINYLLQHRGFSPIPVKRNTPDLGFLYNLIDDLTSKDPLETSSSTDLVSRTHGLNLKVESIPEFEVFINNLAKELFTEKPVSSWSSTISIETILEEIKLIKQENLNHISKLNTLKSIEKLFDIKENEDLYEVIEEAFLSMHEMKIFAYYARKKYGIDPRLSTSEVLDILKQKEYY